MSDHETPLPRDLGEGRTLRVATDDDRDAIIELSVAAHGEVERWGIRACLDDPGIGPSRFTVVTHCDRVVSTLCLMSRTWRYRGGGAEVQLPIGQPEYVATDPGHRDAGLVRAQLDVVHGWSQTRSDLAQTIVGIPYFYRRFGYEYAGGFSPSREIPSEWSVPTGITVRRARPEDLERWMQLDAAAQARHDLSADRSPLALTRMMGDEPGNPYVVVVAERDAAITAVGMSADWDEGPVSAGFVAADDTASVMAVLAKLRDAHPGKVVRAIDRPASLAGVVLAPCPVVDDGWGHYVRVPDPVALLDVLRPVLTARLAASALHRWSGRVLLSLYSSSIALEVEGGEVVGVEPATPVQDPSDDGEVGVAPDLIATLVFGRHGAAELARRHDDVTLGRHAALMEVLFPRMTHDLPTEI